MPLCFGETCLAIADHSFNYHAADKPRQLGDNLTIYPKTKALGTSVKSLLMENMDEKHIHC